ncbi:hypothetical protein Tco_0633620 [Tanacetum coccineum]
MECMSNYSFIFYFNTLASLILLPLSLIFHRSVNHPKLRIRIHGAKAKKGLRKVLTEGKANNEDDQVTEKNSLTMARELKKSRAKVANAGKRDRASPIKNETKRRNDSCYKVDFHGQVGPSRLRIMFLNELAMMMFDDHDDAKIDDELKMLKIDHDDVENDAMMMMIMIDDDDDAKRS